MSCFTCVVTNWFYFLLPIYKTHLTNIKGDLVKITLIFF